ncbi:hypothetical protein H1S01_08460 [Heliobacterium chlorum]|uniref:Uncharacterized protein n=1 Tax=Heliobacterium chlorum TaxID=2698 RepID=A0ABR7T180_HELCL|nr:hypothetical protein [Heliobacterium chlorum]MBC9784544.1 hypothetical protein [Heliobacterium chlorum]
MILSTMTVIALRCPACGRMDFHALSLFSFAGRKVKKIQCSCGAALMTVGSKDRKRFWIQTHCIMCETQHLQWFTRERLWSQQLTELRCTETMVEVGFIGPREKVKTAILSQDKSLYEMAENLGLADYFENPEVMYAILERLHKLAEEGSLSCECGSFQINVEVYPDRVELRCELCDSTYVCYAESDNDLQSLSRCAELQIQGYSPIAPESRRNRRRRTKKTT